MRRVVPIALLVLLLDQVVKALVVAWLPLGTSWAPVPALAHLFQLTHTTNTGMAFGLFQGGSLWLTLVVIAIVVGLLVYARRLAEAHPSLYIALGLVLGGALGNLTDRLTRGAVVDFIDVGPFWIFNLADSCVVVGGLLLAWLLSRPDAPALPAAESADPKGLGDL